MRVAIISDPHGNADALNAAFDDLAQRGPVDAIVGGGDYGTGGVFPHECIARYQQADAACVVGNADQWLLQAATDGRIAVDLDLVPEAMRVEDELTRSVHEWGADRITDSDIAFLDSLPLIWRIEGPSGQRLAYAHATPWSAHPVFGPEMSDDEARQLLERAEADVYFYGHIHHAYQRTVDGQLFGCVGSSGLPFDGDPRPCYVILTDDGDGWTCEHIRFDYDREAYISKLLESGMPAAETWAGVIRTGSR